MQASGQAKGNLNLELPGKQANRAGGFDRIYRTNARKKPYHEGTSFSLQDRTVNASACPASNRTEYR